MKKSYDTGIYKLKTVIDSDLIWHKDNSPAIPFKYEYAQEFFNQIDKITLAKSDLELQPTLIALYALYKNNQELCLDYGHWELLMSLILISILAENLSSDTAKEQLKNQFLSPNNTYRFNWPQIHKFYNNQILELSILDFIKKADHELDEVEKVLRDVAETVWEYTNCFKFNNDDEILDFINKLVEFARVMIIFAPDEQESLSVAASMYGSFPKLLATKLDTLGDEWQNF